jgi:hypothetical protein
MPFIRNPPSPVIETTTRSGAANLPPIAPATPKPIEAMPVAQKKVRG